MVVEELSQDFFILVLQSVPPGLLVEDESMFQNADAFFPEGRVIFHQVVDVVELEAKLSLL